MTDISPATPASRVFLETSRKDGWWVGPLLTGLGLAAFVVYTTWAGLAGDHYKWGPYLSPLYSPEFLFSWWPLSPAIFVLWAPAGFRVTCYYYRKAYYRAFFMTPAACAVGARPQNYKGERAILIFQNLHRFFLYFALALVVILSFDAVKSFVWDGRFGIGVGTIVLTLNAVFIAAFTFGCNSFRHLMGGNVDCYSCSALNRARHKTWKFSSFFNGHHMGWAWISLFWVGFTDLYVRLVAMGVITDLRIL
jgi:hypothetical protein